MVATGGNCGDGGDDGGIRVDDVDIANADADAVAYDGWCLAKMVGHMLAGDERALTGYEKESAVDICFGVAGCRALRACAAGAAEHMSVDASLVVTVSNTVEVMTVDLASLARSGLS